MGEQKLCRNKKTGAIFWWNEFLANNPDIEVIEREGIAGAGVGGLDVKVEGEQKQKVVFGKKKG